MLHRIPKPLYTTIEKYRVKQIYITQIFRVDKVLGNPVPYFTMERTRAKMVYLSIDEIRNILIEKLQQTYKN